MAHGAKAIDESFGSEEFPDTALDVVRDADDAAVAAGVTVVVSSGDAGPTSTIGSPASDPNVISVGATTTFRSYAQSDLGGFYNPVVGNGTWVSNNISSLSSGGFNQSGGTVDLVAPGDGNWALCSANSRDYTGCADTFGGKDIGVQNFGGTSEAAPLTAAAAADVIQAYARAHGGTDPSPALVKQILCSTATDIGAPATEQGAGLLNVAGRGEAGRVVASPAYLHDHDRADNHDRANDHDRANEHEHDQHEHDHNHRCRHDEHHGRRRRSAGGRRRTTHPSRRQSPGRPQPSQRGGAARLHNHTTALSHQHRFGGDHSEALDTGVDRQGLRHRGPSSSPSTRARSLPTLGRSPSGAV